MSVYTTELRYICENAAGYRESQGYDMVDIITTKAAPFIFDNFPIFDESYRLALEKKILNHYYCQEIGFETVGLWRMKLNNRLREIMPYYNQLYLSGLGELNPFIDADYTKDGKREGKEEKGEHREGSGKANQTTKSGTKSTTSAESSGTHGQTTESSDTGSGTNSNTNTNLFANTPQGNLNGTVNFQNYLTDARQITDSGTTSSTMNSNSSLNGNSSANSSGESNTDTATIGDSTSSTQEDLAHQIETTEGYLEHITGKMPGMSYSAMLKEYRETFINIDMMIINDLQNLFMLIY